MPEQDLEYLFFALILASYIGGAISLVCLYRWLRKQRQPVYRPAFIVAIQRGQKSLLSAEDLSFLSAITKDL